MTGRTQLNEAARARLRAMIERRSAPDGTGCRIWDGPPGTHGYGQVRVGERVMTTARATFLAFHGELGRGEVPRHTCDNKRCVEPTHLIRGTHLENMDDWKRRRTRDPHALDVTKVVAIRSSASHGASSRMLAREFGVAATTIQDVVARRTWRQVA